MLGMMAHVCNSFISALTLKQKQVQGPPGLLSEFQASVHYVARPCLHKKIEKNYLGDTSCCAVKQFFET